jgi:hypothetical protein
MSYTTDKAGYIWDNDGSIIGKDGTFWNDPKTKANVRLLQDHENPNIVAPHKDSTTASKPAPAPSSKSTLAGQVGSALASPSGSAATAPSSSGVQYPSGSGPAAPQLNSQYTQTLDMTKYKAPPTGPYESRPYGDQSSALVENRLEGILSKDSPLMQRAATQGMQYANSRGLLNSTMAAGAAQGAMIDRAFPIAQQDAAHFGDLNRMAYGHDLGLSNMAYGHDLGLASAEWTSKLDEGTRARLMDLESQYSRMLNFDQHAADAFKHAMGAIGLLNTNPDLSPEQQQAGTAQIIGMMQSQLGFLNSLYGGSGGIPSFPATGSTGGTAGGSSSGGSSSGGSSSGGTGGSYLSRYPDVQSAYNKSSSAEKQWIASLGYPSTPEGFAKWHYDTYGKAEGRKW